MTLGLGRLGLQSLRPGDPVEFWVSRRMGSGEQATKGLGAGLPLQWTILKNQSQSLPSDLLFEMQ